MKRKRITERFPFLLPLRKWQRKTLFYWHMRFDKNHYAKQIQNEELPHLVTSSSSLQINKDSGYDVQYQFNKVHNLKLAAKMLHHLVIKPGQTFSFWQLVRYADRFESYKDGLNYANGKITGAYGGGLCQISNLLFWLFLHTPLTIVERHGHTAEMIPATSGDLPYGTDATINEGWLDLKVKNETASTYQISLSFDQDYMNGCILSNDQPTEDYRIFNETVEHYLANGKVYRHVSVNCIKTNRETKKEKKTFLYDNVYEIGYPLPEGIKIKEEKGSE